MNEADAIGTARHRRAASFLAQLGGGRRIDVPVAVVVAHPDDETIGVGAQLPRLANTWVVHVTDGAPRSGEDAARAGCATREDYAATRRCELIAAMDAVGLHPERLLSLGLVDQEAGLYLVDLTRRVAGLLAGLDVDVVLTHPYEGGHPDHDATAFAIHAAAALLAWTGRPAPAIVEMASYHAGADGHRITQRFIPDPGRPELVMRLDKSAQKLKRRLFDSHASQRPMLDPFAIDQERFRAAPDYDFSVPPNDGNLLYEQFQWGMTGSRWRQSARSALVALGLEPAE